MRLCLCLSVCCSCSVHQGWSGDFSLDLGQQFSLLFQPLHYTRDKSSVETLPALYYGILLQKIIVSFDLTRLFLLLFTTTLSTLQVQNRMSSSKFSLSARSKIITKNRVSNAIKMLIYTNRIWLLLLQLTHLATWGSIVTWFIFLAVYSHVWPTFDLAPEMVGMVCLFSR